MPQYHGKDLGLAHNSTSLSMKNHGRFRVSLPLSLGLPSSDRTFLQPSRSPPTSLLKLRLLRPILLSATRRPILLPGQSRAPPPHRHQPPSQCVRVRVEIGMICSSNAKWEMTTVSSRYFRSGGRSKNDIHCECYYLGVWTRRSAPT